MESSTGESINEIGADKTKSSKNGKSVSLKHTDSVGILPSVQKDKGKMSAKKKLSHPVSFLSSSNNPKIKIDPISCHNFSSSLSFVSPGEDPRRDLQRKDTKDAKCFTYGEEEADEESLVTCSVTQSLESAVRKLSRSSPNRSGGQPDMPGIRAGLAILARGYEQYREGIHLLNPTEFGEASSDDLSSEWESSADQENNNGSDPMCPLSPAPQVFSLPLSPERPVAKQKGGLSAWRKVKSVVQWTPFMQTFKARNYPWVQLAGHSGNFRPGLSPGTVLKRHCKQEKEIYTKLMQEETLRDFVPKYYQTVAVNEDDELFIELEDLLSAFSSSPCIMDCKIGIRTYLEEELAKAREKPKLRKDMYEKMVAIDPNAPTEEEHKLKGVTKPRYMLWRETISSTATLGFRIEGMKKDGASSKDFKTTSTEDQVYQCFANFLSGYPNALNSYRKRLKQIKEALLQSKFFQTHELIGSSLLFVHDKENVNVRMIDFGKTSPLPENIQINHSSAWEVGNHEDGYMIGLDCIIKIFDRLSLE